MGNDYITATLAVLFLFPTQENFRARICNSSFRTYQKKKKMFFAFSKKVFPCIKNFSEKWENLEYRTLGLIMHENFLLDVISFSSCLSRWKSSHEPTHPWWKWSLYENTIFASFTPLPLSLPFYPGVHSLYYELCTCQLSDAFPFRVDKIRKGKEWIAW